MHSIANLNKTGAREYKNNINNSMKNTMMINMNINQNNIGNMNLNSNVLNDTCTFNATQTSFSHKKLQDITFSFSYVRKGAASITKNIFPLNLVSL